LGQEKPWKSKKVPELLQKFFADDIYSADETGLFYHAMPDGSVSYKHVKLLGSKKAMDRITVQTCQELTKRSCWLLGKVLSLDASRG
jgi:hypothetical protein